MWKRTQEIYGRIPNVRAQVQHQQDMVKIAKTPVILSNKYLIEDADIAAAAQPRHQTMLRLARMHSPTVPPTDLKLRTNTNQNPLSRRYCPDHPPQSDEIGNVSPQPCKWTHCRHLSITESTKSGMRLNRAHRPEVRSSDKSKRSCSGKIR
jgi:hypothetical protein